MSGKEELLASLRETLLALKLQEEDIERIVKEVTQLSAARMNSPLLTIDEEKSEEEKSGGSGSSPTVKPRRKHKTLREGKATKDKRRELLVNSTLLHYKDCVTKPMKEYEDSISTSYARKHPSKEQSVPDLLRLTVASPRVGSKSPTKQLGKIRKRRSTNVGDSPDLIRPASPLTESADHVILNRERERERQRVEAQPEEKMKIESVKISKTQSILLDLSVSEANYLTKLQLIIDEFVTPMRLKAQEQAIGSPGGRMGGIRTSKGWTKEFDGMNVFSNIENIFQISTDFSKELTQVLDKWPKKGIKSPFVMLTHVASAYKQYISNWNTTHEILNNPKSPISIFLQERAYKSQQDLLNLLSLPLTRLPQYEGVLYEILSTLPSVHNDYAGLQDAYQQLKAIVLELDSIRHRSENGACIMRIMRRMVHFDGSLMEEGRLFIHEDEVTFINKKKKHNGVMSLFSDILLFARYAHYSNNLKYKCHLPLNYCSIVANPGEVDDKNAFRLRIRESSEGSVNTDKEHSFLIFAPSFEAKDKWIKEITKVVQNLETIKVFGASLSKHKEMPLFLKKLLNYLNNTVLDLSEEELFKVNGITPQVHKIRHDVDNGKNVDYSNVAIAVSVLKLFLKELPEALLAEMRCWFFELAGEDTPSNEEAAKLYHVIISNLPPLQKEILRELVRFFSSLTSGREGSKITPRSIGVAFGAHLFYGKGDVEPADLQLVNAATEYLVVHFGELFETPA